MHSPESHYSESPLPKETKSSREYSGVSDRLTAIKIQEQEDTETPHPNQLLFDFAHKHSLHSENNEKVFQILSNEADDLQKLGLTLNDLGKEEISEIRRELNLEDDHEGKLSFESRLIELQKTSLPLSTVLETLKTEFGESMDEDTRAVIDNFQSLVSPAIIPDEQEREAVEVLFATQSITAFTLQSFTGFVETIYDEETVSEETKQRIEKKFGIPRTPIETGAELAEWTLKKDENGEYLHSSPDTALEFRKGVKTHVDQQGNTLLTIAGDARTEPMSISPERLKNGEALAALANYSLIRGVVFEEFDQMTNLFGGGAEDELGTPAESAIDDANTFARLLIGKRSPDSILGKADLMTLRQALTALHDSNHSGENAVEAQLQELGILNRGNLQWLKIEEIGTILRNNQNFKTFEQAHSGDAYRLLQQKLKATSEHETEPIGTMHGIGRTVQGLGIRRGGLFNLQPS